MAKISFFYAKKTAINTPKIRVHKISKYRFCKSPAEDSVFTFPYSKTVCYVLLYVQNTLLLRQCKKSECLFGLAFEKSRLPIGAIADLPLMKHYLTIFIRAKFGKKRIGIRVPGMRSKECGQITARALPTSSSRRT